MDNDNNIGKGIIYIVRALQQLDSLEVLGLCNTDALKKAIDDVALAIECNQSLNTCDTLW